MGAVLSQVDDDGQDHPVAYYSRKLLPREQRYSTVEQECLAIKLGVQAFSVYLLGRPFRIQTDHRALQWLDKAKEMNARLTRWSLSLQTVPVLLLNTEGAEQMEMRMHCPGWTRRGAAHQRRRVKNVTNSPPRGSNSAMQLLCSQSNSQGVSSREPLTYKKQPTPWKEAPPDAAAIAITTCQPCP